MGWQAFLDPVVTSVTVQSSLFSLAEPGQALALLLGLVVDATLNALDSKMPLPSLRSGLRLLIWNCVGIP